MMRRVQEIVDRIERGDGETVTVRHAADQVISRLRKELGIWGGRLYERDGEDYVLRATFPDARAGRSARYSHSRAPIHRSSCA